MESLFVLLRRAKVALLSGIMLALTSTGVYAESWKPIKDPKILADLFSDTTMEAKLKEGVQATATYKKDGTGEVKAWGDTFQRTWKIKGKDQVCIGMETKTNCFQLERSVENKEKYRATNLVTDEKLVFTIRKIEAKIAKVDSPTTAGGGAAKPSAEEMAAKLANPNAPLASMTFKYQYRTFEGTLPDAHNQSSHTVLFQPSFPFKLENGDVIFFRPAIPLILDQPVFNTTSSSFDSESGIGDIAFDLAYGRTTKQGYLYAAGIVSSLPTATEDSLGSDRFTLGPEFLIGKLTKKHVFIAFPSHQWDVGGSGNADINMTSLQLIYTHLPGGGWNIGTAPTMTYNHITDESTIPLNLTIGKTVIWEGRPWKLSMEINHYIETPDAFAPEWMIGFNVAPVVENMFAEWFK